MIRIVIVSQSTALWKQIQAMLPYNLDFTIVGYGKDDYAGLHLIEQEQPDIALLDTALPFSTAPELLPLIRRRSPQTRTIILRSSHEDDLVLRAIGSGAAGHLPKRVDEAVYAAGIRFVDGGGSLMSPEMIEQAYTQYPPLAVKLRMERQGNTYEPPNNLLSKELWLIALVGLGLANHEIAELLGFKTGTVRNQVSELLRKLGLRSRTELAIYAINTALVNERILKQAKEKVEELRLEKAAAAHAAVRAAARAAVRAAMEDTGAATKTAAMDTATRNDQKRRRG
jgi:DNA-binding NarL/FixJ family response regulator